MVDASYGGGPSNSNVQKIQLSGHVLTSSAGYVGQSTVRLAHISGIGSISQGGLVASGIYVLNQFGALSGIATDNTPTSESSWNV